MSTPQTPFYLQNLHAAKHILDMLDPATNILSVISEASPTEAPHIEDFVIQYESGAYDYYQIKTLSNGKFTTGNLLEIWSKLAKGWMYAIGKGTGKVTIYLVTNQTFGDKRSRSSDGVERPSLTQIISQLIMPCKQASNAGLLFTPSAEFADFWNLLRAESQLNEKFENFISDLEFISDTSSQETLREDIKAKFTTHVYIEKEAERLTSYLLEAITEWAANRTIVNKTALLERLGLAGRGLMLHRHTLTDVVPKDYTPFGNIQETLELSIANITKGYIFLRGAPGSGKTINITKFIEMHPDVLLRYYAYNPGEHSDRTDRVKRTDFYHDLMIQLSNRFPDKRLPKLPDPQQDFRDLFWKTIRELAKDIEKPVILIIDGIDHAARAKVNDVRTFFDGLIGPDEIPDNLIIILSGQPSWSGYPAWLENNNFVKIIDVPLMTIDDIKRYLENTGLWNDGNFIHQISLLLHKTTYGNPLSVRYAVQVVKACDSIVAVEEILAKNKLPTQDLQLYYTYLWDDISRITLFQNTPSLLKVVQALFTVAREPIRPELFEPLDISPIEAITIFELLGAVLLNCENGKVIYHNDFRLFLEAQIDLLVKKYVHKKLAYYYLKTPTEDGYHVHVVDHLWNAEEYAQIVDICTQERYDNKIASNRSDYEITKELNTALISALKIGDLLSIIRTGLLLIRHTTRLQHWEAIENKVFEVRPPAKLSIEDLLLLIPPHPDEKAFVNRTKVLRQLAKHIPREDVSAFKKIFDLWSIEPSVLFANEDIFQNGIMPNDILSYLIPWTKCTLIIDNHKIINLYNQLAEKAKSEPDKWQLGQLFNSYQSHAKSLLWQTLSFEQAIDLKKTMMADGWNWDLTDILWGAEYYLRRGKREHAKILTAEALPLAQKEGGSLAARTAWFLVMLGEIEEAGNLSALMTLPFNPEYKSDSITSLVHNGSEWNIYRYFAVKAYFDIYSPIKSFRVDLSQFSYTDPAFTGRPLLRLCPLMALMGRLERNVKLVPVHELMEILGPVIENNQGNLKELSEGLVELCLHKIASSDKGLARELAAWISGLFDDGRVEPYKVISLVDWFYNNGQQSFTDKIIEKLTTANNLGNRLPTERAEQFLDASLIMDFLGNKPKADKYFVEARLASEGVGYRKDYQLASWSDVIVRLIKLDRTLGLKFARRFIHYGLLERDETEGFRTGYYAISGLLPAIFSESPEEGEAVCLEISEKHKAVPLEEGILDDVVEHLVDICDSFDRRECSALLALISVGPGPRKEYERDDTQYSNILLRLKLIAEQSTAGLEQYITHLARSIPQFDIMESKAQCELELKKVSIEDVKDRLYRASEPELFYQNYSREQRDIFDDLSKLPKAIGWVLYKDACLSHLIQDEKFSSFKARGFIEMLLDLIPDEYIEQTASLLDSHMARILRYSLQMSPAPTSLLTAAKSGGLFETSTRLSAHLLNSRDGRTYLQAGRALALLTRTDPEQVIKIVTGLLETKDAFYDMRLLRLLVGIAHTHPGYFRASIQKHNGYLESCNDLLRKESVIKIFETISRIYPDITQPPELIIENNKFIEPINLLEMKVEEKAEKDLFVHEVDDQIHSYSRKLSKVTIEYVSEQEWITYLKALVSEADTKPRFTFASSSHLYKHVQSSDNNLSLLASKVAWKLVEAGRIPFNKVNHLAQAITGVDPILLTRWPSSVPNFLRLSNKQFLDTPEYISGPNGWRVIGISRTQAEEKTSISIRVCSGLFPKRDIKELEDSKLVNGLFNLNGTFGWTLDQVYSYPWFDFNKSPYIPLTVPSGSLIPFPLLMSDIALTPIPKSEGLVPHAQIPTIWYDKEGNEALKFITWDYGTDYERPLTGQYTDFGFLWLAEENWLSIIERKYARIAIQLAHVSVTVRDYRDRPFKPSEQSWYALVNDQTQEAL